MRYKTGTRVRMGACGLHTGKEGVVIPPRLDARGYPVTSGNDHPFRFRTGRDVMVKTDRGDVICHLLRCVSRA